MNYLLLVIVWSFSLLSMICMYFFHKKTDASTLAFIGAVSFTLMSIFVCYSLHLFVSVCAFILAFILAFMAAFNSDDKIDKTKNVYADIYYALMILTSVLVYLQI